MTCSVHYNINCCVHLQYVCMCQHLCLMYIHLGTLLCSFLGKYTIHSTIISIQVNGVEGLTLSDALAMSPIHLQFEVVLLPA